MEAEIPSIFGSALYSISLVSFKLKKLTTYCPVPGYADEIVHVYYAEVEKINNKNTYNKFENEEINIFKLNHILKIEIT